MLKKWLKSLAIKTSYGFYLRSSAFIIVATYFSAGVVSAQNVGSQSASWLRIPTDARNSALGGALVAVADDTGSLAVNPAGLAMVTGSALSFSHSFWAQDLSLEHGAFGTSVNGIGLAGSANYLNFGAFDQYEIGPSGLVANGSFTPQALAFSAGGGVQIVKGVYAGAAVNWAGQNLTGSFDSAFSGNLGLLYRHESGFSMGAALLNAGQALEGFTLPLQVSAGAAFQKDLGLGPAGEHSILAAGQWDYLPNSALSSFSFGGEYWYQQRLALRAGYRLSSYGNSDGLRGFSAGAGFRFSQLEISYALITLGSLGNSHQISLSFRL